MSARQWQTTARDLYLFGFMVAVTGQDAAPFPGTTALLRAAGDIVTVSINYRLGALGPRNLAIWMKTSTRLG